MPTSEKTQEAFSLKKAFTELTRLRTKLTGAFKEIEEVKKRIIELARDVRELKEMFSTTDNWGALAKQLIADKKEVVITTVQGVALTGLILWVDRYNIGFRARQSDKDIVEVTDGMLLKGGLVGIFPTKE